MSDGLSIESGKITITRGTRTVATTLGTLICLLPTVYTFSAQVLTFPDFSKDICYLWEWGTDADPFAIPTTYAKGENAACWISAVPQELFTTVPLMAWPDGADFLVTRVKLTRTTAPLNQWRGKSIAVLPVQNQWITSLGAYSALLETDIGFGRAMHVYVAGGNLNLALQQSVGPPPAGYNVTFGDSVPATSLRSGGGNFTFNTTAGLPIFLRSSGSYGWTTPVENPSKPAIMTKTGSAKLAQNDTTQYRSVYSLDIQVRIGRRS